MMQMMTPAARYRYRDRSSFARLMIAMGAVLSSGSSSRGTVLVVHSRATAHLIERCCRHTADGPQGARAVAPCSPGAGPPAGGPEHREKIFERALLGYSPRGAGPSSRSRSPMREYALLRYAMSFALVSSSKSPVKPLPFFVPLRSAATASVSSWGVASRGPYASSNVLKQFL